MTTAPTRRGTSNSNDRGNNVSRRQRREWLVTTYRADRDVLVVTWPDGRTTTASSVNDVDVWATLGAVSAAMSIACRCYRCGRLLTVHTVTVDRIVPGCEGGTYDRTNIRPACGPCNSKTGGHLGAERQHGKRGTRVTLAIIDEPYRDEAGRG